MTILTAWRIASMKYPPHGVWLVYPLAFAADVAILTGAALWLS